MVQVASVYGRCPRCEQVLTLPVARGSGTLRCARCQYRAPAEELVEAARKLPPRGQAVPLPDLPRFEEAEDDMHTELFVPSTVDDASEVPLSALADDEEPSGSREPPSIEMGAEPASDAPVRAFAEDDELTRMRWVDSNRPSSSSMPSSNPPAAPMAEPPSPSGGSQRPPTQTPTNAEAAASLSRFGEGQDDPDDQSTQLHMPISYEDDEPVPDLRAPTATTAWANAEQPGVASSAVGWRPSLATQFGMDTLQLSRFIDDWLQGRRTVLLLTLAMLCAAIAPALDHLTGNVDRAATVISANLVLFFLWTLAFAWLGKLRNDRWVWDYRVAFTRLGTHARLIVADLSRFGSLPGPLRLLSLAEVFKAIGLLGLWLCCTLTVSQLVWSVPESVTSLFLGRFSSSVLVALAAVCRSGAATLSAGLPPGSDVSAPTVSRFPAIVDLSVPLHVSPELRATALYALLEVLAKWEPQSFPNRDSYQSALQRHLYRHLPWAQIQRDRWLGPERTDGVAQVMLNDHLLIEVARGFDATAASRLDTRMRRLARTWRGKPALVVVFDASRTSVSQSEATPPLELLHEAYPMLTVRMPSANPLYY